MRTFLEILNRNTPSVDTVKINAFLNRAPPNTSILLTSRQRKNLVGEKRIDLEGLTIDEGRIFFVNIAGDEYLENASKKLQIAIENVIEKTGGHPLTIEILARSYQGLGIEELEEMAKNIDVKTTNPWEPEERLKSLKASFDYSLIQVENKVRNLLPKMSIFKSPFPISAVSSIFGMEKVDVINLYNRSWLTRIDSDEYGKLEQEAWLYKFHPAVKNYLEDELKKNDGIDLEYEYGDKFSRYYYTRLSETNNSLKENAGNSSYIRQFNIIMEGTCNDFDRSIALQKNLEERIKISKLVGDLLLKFGRMIEAIKYYDIVLEINPNLTDVWYCKAYALRQSFRYEDAIECYNRILMINHNEIECLIEKIESLSCLRRNEEALECYNMTLPLLDDAINKESLNPIVWQNKGRALDYIGREEEALQCYNKALEINADDLQVLDFKANSLTDMGRYEEALECYNKILELNPSDSWTWNNRGCGFSNLGNHKDALECYNKALEKMPNHPTLYCNKGDSLYRLGRNEEALECYNKAFKIDPNYQESWAWSNMGSVLDRIGKHEESIESHNTALRLFDKSLDIPNGIALNYKGESLYGLGRYEEALECYNKALDLNPNYIIAQNNKEAVIEKLTRTKTQDNGNK